MAERGEANCGVRLAAIGCESEGSPEHGQTEFCENPAKQFSTSSAMRCTSARAALYLATICTLRRKPITSEPRKVSRQRGGHESVQ